MAGIYYSLGKDGTEIGRWSGDSIRRGNYVTHSKQLYLGKVIDKSRLIFYKKEQGFYQFDPKTQTMSSVPDEQLPDALPQLDKRLRNRNVIVSFGGSYFLQELITHIEYTKVLDSIVTKTPDTMYGLLHYYALSPDSDCNAFRWYQNSYARFLFPQANLSSQRISDFYATFGNDSNRRAFFEHHIPYVSSVTDDEYAILIDSTGCQNACNVPFTKVSKHNNEINVEFRLVVVIQRSTGLPVYYEIIPGNVIDSSTIDRIIKLMKVYDYKVTHVSGDAGYSCPANIEKVIICGSDLIMRLNPAYNQYKTIAAEHSAEMSSTAFNPKTDVHYRNRVVRVLKIPCVIGTDMDNKEVTGYVYLCRDLQAYHSKSDHYMKYHGKDAASAEAIIEACEKFGEFAIISTQDMEIRDVIPTYYMRQGVEQFFDYAKNMGKMMPVRNHNEATISGHMLMSFITTFLVIAIKNRMNIMDTPYVAIPKKLNAGEDTILINHSDNDQEHILVQDTESSDVFRSSPSALFTALNFVGADVFDGRKTDNQLIPAVPYKDANDFFRAFGIPCPEAVLIQEDRSLKVILKPTVKITCKKSKVFATRPFASAEEIERELKAKEEAKAKKSQSDSTPQQSEAVPKPKRGRPKGSKNKKTLKREEAGDFSGSSPVKRKPGRPAGSKDKTPRKKRGTKNAENNR